jgi:hypothetical protein
MYTNALCMHTPVSESFFAIPLKIFSVHPQMFCHISNAKDEVLSTALGSTFPLFCYSITLSSDLLHTLYKVDVM